MIDIKINIQDVFTYDAENISIGIHQPIVDFGFFHVGNISFSNLRQAEHFAEMIEFMIEKVKE